MPIEAQRRTSASPAAVSPGPVSGEEGKANGTPWANAFGRLHTGPSERSPAAYQRSSASRPGSIASAPSTWATAARTPASRAASRSPGARAIRTCPSRSSPIRRPSVRATFAAASSWEIGAAISASSSASSKLGVAVKAAKMPPASPPWRARGRSMSPPSRPVAKRSASSRVSVSLWPSKTGSIGRMVASC